MELDDRYIDLAAAIIKQSVKDHKRNDFRDEVEVFWNSEIFDVYALGQGAKLRAEFRSLTT